MFKRKPKPMFNPQQLQKQVDALSKIIEHITPLDMVRIRMIQAYAALPFDKQANALAEIKSLVVGDDDMAFTMDLMEFVTV